MLSRAGALGLAALAFLAGAALAPASANAVVLGSPEYHSHGYGAGFGEARPSSISNGGSPGGIVYGVRWRRWGSKVAHGRGLMSISRPTFNYYAERGKVRLRARRIGRCPGQEKNAYLILEIRAPQWPGGPLGSWRKWSGTLDTCDYAVQDPRYKYPKPSPGACGDITKQPATTWSPATPTGSTPTGSAAKRPSRSSTESASASPKASPAARSAAAESRRRASRAGSPV